MQMIECVLYTLQEDWIIYRRTQNFYMYWIRRAVGKKIIKGRWARESGGQSPQQVKKNVKIVHNNF